MSEGVVDAMGPVGYLVVEFPRGRSTFDREFAVELARLSLEGVIRVLDLLVIQKGADGVVQGFEVDDLDMDVVRALDGDLADLLAAEDVVRLAEVMEPRSVAGVVVWENLWALPLASTARRGGGRLLADGHIPLQDIADDLVADGVG